MRLISLIVPGRYGALLDTAIKFRTEAPDDSLAESPICLVGLNGSGKSNVIEALSEIFCFLDLLTKEYGPSRGDRTAAKAPFPFRLEYATRRGETKKEIYVRITTEKGKAPKLEIGALPAVKPKTDINWTILSLRALAEVLPSAVVGYSSGHNETVSFPYLRAESYYSEAVREAASPERQRGPSGQRLLSRKRVRRPSAYFVDYEFNALLLISNSLFQPHKMEEFLHQIHVKSLRSFRFRISFELRASKEVVRTLELESSVDKLTRCALIVRGDRRTKEGLVLDFYANEETRKHFRKEFKNALDLFAALHRLNLLNALKLETPEREYYRRDLRRAGLIPKPPTVPERSKVFSTTGVQVFLGPPASGRDKNFINYSGLSDGEHQVALIFGLLALFDQTETIFLLDEPESHFNPRWRAEFVGNVWKLFKHRIKGANTPELVISTHSPFVVSGCRAQNVFKFERNENRISVSQLTTETYGSSFDYLLSTLFDMGALMASKPAEEMKLLLRGSSKRRLEAATTQFGGSIEKAALFARLAELDTKRRRQRALKKKTARA